MGTIKLLRRKTASAYLQEVHGLERAVATLAKLAVTGCGPVFRRDGRVPLYSTDDLDAWAASILSPPMRSTKPMRTARSEGNGTVSPEQSADERKAQYAALDAADDQAG